MDLSSSSSAWSPPPPPSSSLHCSSSKAIATLGRACPASLLLAYPLTYLPTPLAWVRTCLCSVSGTPRVAAEARGGRWIARMGKLFHRRQPEEAVVGACSAVASATPVPHAAAAIAALSPVVASTTVSISMCNGHSSRFVVTAVTAVTTYACASFPMVLPMAPTPHLTSPSRSRPRACVRPQVDDVQPSQPSLSVSFSACCLHQMCARSHMH
eukprot:690773-Pleurochrysis_carterae.AAC.2